MDAIPVLPTATTPPVPKAAARTRGGAAEGAAAAVAAEAVATAPAIAKTTNKTIGRSKTSGPAGKTDQTARIDRAGKNGKTASQPPAVAIGASENARGPVVRGEAGGADVGADRVAMTIATRRGSSAPR